MADIAARMVQAASLVKDEQHAAAQPQALASFLDRRNLVLLGDPGAGKSYLFRNLGSASGARYLTTSEFLNLPAAHLQGVTTLFIDALDEHRITRNSTSIIDELARKLWAVSPQQVRISCREAEWRREIDGLGLDSYFSHNGGVTELHVMPLSPTEQAAVVGMHGIPDAHDFLNEAKERGLDELLLNPQTLIMLAKVVSRGTTGWPRRRYDLYDQTVSLLLSERNAIHAETELGSLGPEELCSAAGAICAVRLIADIDGISLGNHSRSSRYPSVRDITIADKHMIAAALRRNLFVAGNGQHTVDYVHRTIAEFLGAQWLARKHNNGLPLSRIRALIGYEGKPASELRGLHAWLAITSQDAARELIAADPTAILRYADVGALTSSMRIHLMRCLSALAQKDPEFFHRGDFHGGITALASPEVAGPFRDILNDTNAPYSMRWLALEALSRGEPLPTLQAELLNTFLNADRSLGERCLAVDALVKQGHTACSAIITAYATLSNQSDDIALRSHVLQHLYGQGIGAAEFAVLLHDLLQRRGDRSIGYLFGLDEAIPDTDLEALLNSLEAITQPPNHRDYDRSQADAARIIELLLCRLLARPEDVLVRQVDVVIRWLETRRRLFRNWLAPIARVKLLLERSPRLLVSMAERLLDAWPPDEDHIEFILRIDTTMMGSLDRQWWFNALLARARGGVPSDRERSFRASFYLLHRYLECSTLLFERWFAVASDAPILIPARLELCIHTIPDHYFDTVASQRQRTAERDRQHDDLLVRFDQSTDAIRAGTHLGWLAWVSNAYYGCNSENGDQMHTARGNLVASLGEERTEAALQGLRAYVSNPPALSPNAVLASLSQDEMCKHWSALLAGLDEQPQSDKTLLGIAPSHLESALIIATACPKYERAGRNSTRPVAHWWQRRAVELAPQQVIDAYTSLARVELHAGKEHPKGVQALLGADLVGAARNDAVRGLLLDFPAMPCELLTRCLVSWLERATSDAATSLVEDGLAQCEVTQPQHLCWLAAGFMVNPTRFCEKLLHLAEPEAIEVIWQLRDLAGFSKFRKGSMLSLDLPHLAIAIPFACRWMPPAEPPLGGWCGDRSAWDASQFIKGMVTRLAAQPSDEARRHLHALLNAKDTRLYRDMILHAAAEQDRVRTDTTFSKSDVASVVASLSNRAPANVADLHALVVDQLLSYKSHVANDNIDAFAGYWNEGAHRARTSAKAEDAARDTLVAALRHRMQPLGINVEPEGHMANDKRADVVITCGIHKVVVECKRQIHGEVWTAITTQLDRLYTRDPGASGFGVYCVFWYGSGHIKRMKKPPGGVLKPSSALEMERILNQALLPGQQPRLRAVVIDVSGDVPAQN